MPDPNRVIAGLRCRDLLSVLPDYVDGELSAPEVGRVDAHLRGCVHCTKFGGAYGGLVGSLRNRPIEATVSAGVRARLAHRIQSMWRDQEES